MRIVIDLQACQSTGSRNRGIGRYSLALAKAMLRNPRGHEFHILLSDAFPDTIDGLRATFSELLPPERLHVWRSVPSVAELFEENAMRVQAAQLVREQALAQLRPDFVHIASLFEGSGDDTVSSIGLNTKSIPTAVTLYDLIPLVYQDRYLVDKRQRAWYYRRLQNLRKADLLLAISESSRVEGLKYLQMKPERLVNISSAVDDCFFPAEVPPSVEQNLRERYGLSRPYVMYTGGIDLRKNIDGLIAAYARLPKSLRSELQLAIVCSVHSDEKERLKKYSRSLGLVHDELIFTGFVPDADLPLLYRCCRLFVFPSWHEGFGLPALEAMSCGVPVIAANSSSLPEVLNNDAALFDPHSTDAIAIKMQEVLLDEQFAEELVRLGLSQAKSFSWDESARRAIEAIEAVHEKKSREKACKSLVSCRPKLALISPLPPVQSGIADYCAELIPALADYYDIDLIVDQETVSDDWLYANFRIRSKSWYLEHFNEFDRVVFHLGNSPAHTYMLELFEYRPGIIVLHDFYLGDLLAYLDLNAVIPGVWTKALYQSHGYYPLLLMRDPQTHRQLIREFPCSLSYLEDTEGIIVHSRYSMELARTWGSETLAARCKVIPHLRKMPITCEKQSARRKLGIHDDELVLCSFGLLGPNKLNHRLLDACIEGGFFETYKLRLVYVGQISDDQYGRDLLNRIASSGAKKRIEITGFASIELYRDYLQAADIAVQLRTSSRGESSGTIFDSLAYGVPLIANKNGAISEMPDEIALLIEDEFKNPELISAIERLCSRPEVRSSMSARARAFISSARDPAQIASLYFQTIENIVEHEPNAIFQSTLKRLAQIDACSGDDDWRMVANALASNQVAVRSPVVYLDVGKLPLISRESPFFAKFDALFIALFESLLNRRIEFVKTLENQLYYARTWCCQQFGLLTEMGTDDLVEFREGDWYFSLTPNSESAAFLAKPKSYYRLENLDEIELNSENFELQTFVKCLRTFRDELAVCLAAERI